MRNLSEARLGLTDLERENPIHRLPFLPLMT